MFTERVEVNQKEISNEELEKRIREKLSKYMGKADVIDVEDIVETKVVAEKQRYKDE